MVKHPDEFTVHTPTGAGPAVAKSETAAPVVGRWYFVADNGAATLCVDEADARESASEADIAFPRRAPHRAVQLFPAAQLAEAQRDAGREIERLRDVCDDLYSDLLAAGSLAPRDCGAYALIQETIKLRRDRWARRQMPNADLATSPLSAPVAHKE